MKINKIIPINNSTEKLEKDWAIKPVISYMKM